MTRSLAPLRQLVGLALIGLASAAPSAAQTDDRLIGAWDVLRVLGANGEDQTAQNEGARMTFLADGTLVLRFTNGTDTPVGEDIETTYRVEGETLVVLDTNGTEQSLFYRFEGDELVLTPDPSTQAVAYLRRTPMDP